MYERFTSFIATCGGRGWYRRHALPPAPETHQQGQSVGADERTPVDQDESEGFTENKTEETSATVVKISPFKKDFLSIEARYSGLLCLRPLDDEKGRQ